MLCNVGLATTPEALLFMEHILWESTWKHTNDKMVMTRKSEDGFIS